MAAASSRPSFSSSSAWLRSMEWSEPTAASSPAASAASPVPEKVTVTSSPSSLTSASSPPLSFFFFFLSFFFFLLLSFSFLSFFFFFFVDVSSSSPVSASKSDSMGTPPASPFAEAAKDTSAFATCSPLTSDSCLIGEGAASSVAPSSSSFTDCFPKAPPAPQSRLALAMTDPLLISEDGSHFSPTGSIAGVKNSGSALLPDEGG
mmetsp:Transcript_20491/g.59395  ORF Transcript_20491/g.59395 Transcript_20491/m.59395 type:complete len:205 (+) Transcript_20491:3486-4100(+)